MGGLHAASCGHAGPRPERSAPRRVRLSQAGPTDMNRAAPEPGYHARAVLPRPGPHRGRRQPAARRRPWRAWPSACSGWPWCSTRWSASSRRNWPAGSPLPPWRRDCWSVRSPARCSTASARHAAIAAGHGLQRRLHRCARRALPGTHRQPGIAAAPWSALYALTNPLSAAGVRTLLPKLVPAAALDRANALDTSIHATVDVSGPALAGALFGFAGPSPHLARDCRPLRQPPASPCCRRYGPCRAGCRLGAMDCWPMP